MSIVRMLFREIAHRKLNFILGLISVVAAVALFVAVLTMCEASKRETTRLMRDLGFNVLIVPKNTNMADFWSEDYAAEDMPEEYVYRLANAPIMTIRHLVARLQRKVEWRGRKILLTGVLPEVPQKHLSPKPPMGLNIPRGSVYVGHELAKSFNIKVGQKIDILGKKFTVARLLKESGSKDDIRIYGHLHDIQEVLGLPGRINEIEALSCRCFGDRLASIRQDIAAVLPDTHVTEFRTKAIARAETRKMVERYAAFIIPAVLVMTAVWIGVLTLMNVRERREEIGILRALGVGSGPIAALFIGRALVVGIVGAGLGFALGTWVALRVGPNIFSLTANKISPMFALLGWSLVGAPLLCALASYLPAMAAVLQDPAEVLQEE